MSQYTVEMVNITKKFGDILANNKVCLQLKKGEIHALLGENGAGKSTLMSILFGMYQPDEGYIKKDGKIVEINSPNDATALQIGMVHQHFKLVGIFSVLDNIILGAEPKSLGFVKRQQARKEIEQLSEQYGLYVDLDAKVDDITVGMQQRVEILKMLYRNNEVLIFDEPTAVLTPQEIEELMKIMKNLANEGKSILFITHKLNEIKAVAHRCTILRKGVYIDTVDVASTTKEELSEKMVGRKVFFGVNKKEIEAKDTILRVENLFVTKTAHKADAVKNVSFNVKAGEVVCIAGIDGNGQTELIHAITGLTKAKKGKIYIKDIQVTSSNIKTRSKAGMSHIPEDRHKHGLVLDYSLENNLVLQKYWTTEFTKYGMLRKKNIRKHAEKLIEEYDVRSASGPTSICRQMSGGNQQKAIIARELDKKPELLIAVQPTRGLDVGAIEYIHGKIIQQRDEGKAVLLVSFELDEVMNLSDRILVMYEGEIVAEVKPEETTTQELGLFMSGAKRNVGEAHE